MEPTLTRGQKSRLGWTPSPTELCDLWQISDVSGFHKVKIQGHHLFKTHSVGMEQITEALSSLSLSLSNGFDWMPNSEVIWEESSFQIIMLNLCVSMDHNTHSSLAKVYYSNKMNAK